MRARSVAAVGVAAVLGVLVGGVGRGVIEAQQEGEPCDAQKTGDLVIVDLATCATSTTSTTTAAPTTTTVVPSTSTTSSTVAPSTSTSTTAPPATTAAPTTAPAVTTTSVAPATSSSTSSTQPAPSTTQPSSGVAFSEDFTDPAGGFSRFDHGFSGEWDAGSAWGGNANDWPADHAGPNEACGDPMTSHRTITLTSQRQAQDAVFFPCVPAASSAGGHLMSAVNTEGYVTVWFSPKQVFHNVRRVCFDVNATDEGGGKWLAVQFLTPDEYVGQTDLGYTTWDFRQQPNLPSSPQGAASYGVKLFQGGIQPYGPNGFTGASGYVQDPNRAPRYQRCIEDLGGNRLRISAAGPTGTITNTVAGTIPDGDLRVVFVDDNYNPDKHCGWSAACPGHNANGEVGRNTMPTYTWHWDNIVIE